MRVSGRVEVHRIAQRGARCDEARRVICRSFPSARRSGWRAISRSFPRSAGGAKWRVSAVLFRGAQDGAKWRVSTVLFRGARCDEARRVICRSFPWSARRREMAYFSSSSAKRMEGYQPLFSSSSAKRIAFGRFHLKMLASTRMTNTVRMQTTVLMISPTSLFGKARTRRT